MRIVAAFVAALCLAPAAAGAQGLRCEELEDVPEDQLSDYLSGYAMGVHAGVGFSLVALTGTRDNRAPRAARYRFGTKEGFARAARDSAVRAVLDSLEAELSDGFVPQGIDVEEMTQRMSILCNRPENSDSSLLLIYLQAVREVRS